MIMPPSQTMEAPQTDAQERTPATRENGTTVLLRQVRGILRSWSELLKKGPVALGRRKKVKTQASDALERRKDAEQEKAAPKPRKTLLGIPQDLGAAGRHVTTQDLDDPIDMERFPWGQGWYLNRAGRGHARNEDGQYVNKHRFFFASIDGISGGGTGRQAAVAFKQQLKRYFGDQGTVDMECDRILEKVAIHCADVAFPQAGVVYESGVVFVAAQVGPGGRIKIFWQGDASAATFRADDHEGVPSLQGFVLHTPPEINPDGVITNCVGPEFPGQLNVKEITLAPGDFLLLCSDGVTDGLSPTGGAKQEGEPEERKGKLMASSEEGLLNAAKYVVTGLSIAQEEGGDPAGYVAASLRAVAKRLCERMDAGGCKKDNFNAILLQYVGPSKE